MAPWETHHLLLALASGAVLAYSIEQLLRQHRQRQYHVADTRPNEQLWNGSETRPDIRPPPAAPSLASTVGNTPLVLLPALSRLTQCSIYAKLELLNPGGSPKDRVALSIINSLSNPSPTSRSNPVLSPGDTIYEGTVGSTGISLATLSRALSLYCHIIMPSDQSLEKVSLLRKLGATVTRVAPAPIVDQAHFVNTARRLAAEHTIAYETNQPLHLPDGTTTHVTGRGWFANQFETPANYLAHYTTTGPEIWSQTSGRIDAFVAGAGTGGTVSGTGLFLKERNPNVQVVLADPQGSGLYNKVKHGIFWSAYEREGTRRRSQVDTVIEGIGLVRSTRNWEVGSEQGVVDEAVKVSDGQARNMARWLVEQEGWFVGGSSAINCKLVPWIFGAG
jgi:cysteine synthase